MQARLTPTLVTATTSALLEEAVTLEQARKACHVEHTEDDTEIAGHLRAAMEWLQPPTGWLGRSMLTQTLRLDMPAWLRCSIELPAGPIVSISSVKYFDADNAEQTLAGANYFQDGDALVFVDAFTEPTLYRRPGAVRIEYIAGYTAAAMPAPLKNALLQLTAHFYQHRGDTEAAIPPTVYDLCAPFRRYR